MAREYDSLIRRAVPRYAEMTRYLVDYLPAGSQRIVELGCGTGNLTLRLAKRFPRAALSVVDASPEMVELTRRRLTRQFPRVARRSEFITARFEDLDLPRGSCDLVTSCISLHHVRDKLALYRKVHRWLTAGSGSGDGSKAGGGTFRFADQLRGATEATHAFNWARWLAFCRRAGGCTKGEIRSLLDHAAAHDFYTPLAEHFCLLAKAGFPVNRLDCVWRHLIWGIVVADR